MKASALDGQGTQGQDHQTGEPEFSISHKMVYRNATFTPGSMLVLLHRLALRGLEAAEVGDNVAEFAGGEDAEHGGHHGDGWGLHGDLRAREFLFGAVGEAEGHGGFVFFEKGSGVVAAVLHGDGDEAVAGDDLRDGIDEAFEQLGLRSLAANGL